MQTDRELLELAAKASGITGEWGEFPGMATRHGMTCGIFDSERGDYWNPLQDDGDALRLAVKFKMGIHYKSQFFDTHAERIVEVYHSHEDNRCQCVAITYTDDAFAATRRAIVRAAASIGGGEGL